jgi:sec-independent protein translocase protein TatA
MFGLGTGEVVMLAVVVFIIFSASRMGQLGNALGKFVYSFKKASHGNGFVDVTPMGKARIEPKIIEADVTKRNGNNT